MTLDHDDIDALADALAPRLAELLREDTPPPGAMIDAKTKAAQLAMSLDDIYRQAPTLGGIKIGARWRFPAEPPKQPQTTPATPRIRHRKPHATVPLLPIRG